MKKFNIAIYLFFFFCSAFFCTTSVKAIDINLCEYEYGKKSIRLIYDNDKSKYYMIYSSNSGKRNDIMWLSNKKAYISDAAWEELTSGHCPNNAYLDIDANDEICFDNWDTSNHANGYCQKYKDFPEGERLRLTVSEFVAREYNILEKAEDVDLSDKSCTEFVDTKEELENMLSSEIKAYIDESVYGYPKGFVDRVNEFLPDEFTDIVYANGYESFKNRCKVEFEEQVAAGTMTEVELNEKLDILENIDLENVRADISKSVLNYYGDTYTGRIYCGIFGVKTFGFIKSAYTVIKILIPVLVILLGIIDFLKVVFSGEEKDMKTSGARFLKRILIGIVFILLPVLIEFLMNIFGFSKDCLLELIK